MLSLNERAQDQNEMLQRMSENNSYDLRVASPGIIQSFNPSTQTATVQLAIREKINIDGNVSHEEIPTLLDVPVFMPRAGGYCLTLPVSAGDECLVIFGDNCMDAWWQSGGVQNQLEKRRHDLSDGYALVGIWSQPRVVSGYSASTAQLRNEAGTAYIELAGNNINLVGANVTVTASGNFNINADSYAVTANHSNMNGSGTTVIDGKTFLSHHHSDPQGGNTGGVT